MASSRRAFIFGAGFSKPAGMPLATDLVPLLLKELQASDDDEMTEWLNHLRERLVWLSRYDQEPDRVRLNIEEVFHLAHFDIEVHRLRQHLASGGREGGPGTSWKVAESIRTWLSHMAYALCDVILDRQERSNMGRILRWAAAAQPQDAVLTFNYDTLAERALTASEKPWSHGFSREGQGIPVFKLHGSIDWIVAERSEPLSKCDLLFDKPTADRPDGARPSGHNDRPVPGGESPLHVEDACQLWRCRTPGQLRKWIEGRHLQLIREGGYGRTVGMVGLGAYKELHQIPGLGEVWIRGMHALFEADLAVVVGFSLSDFDMMAQLQFAEVARARIQNGRPLRVRVIDPSVNPAAKRRFQRIFGDDVEFTEKTHETFDWSDLA